MADVISLHPAIQLLELRIAQETERGDTQAAHELVAIACTLRRLLCGIGQIHMLGVFKLSPCDELNMTELSFHPPKARILCTRERMNDPQSITDFIQALGWSELAPLNTNRQGDSI